MQSNMNLKNIPVVLMILAAALSRLIPHAPNFTAVGAMALIAGSAFGLSRQAFLVPLCAMLLADSLLGFHSGIPFVYGALALNVILAHYLLQNRHWMRIGGVILLSSISFFIVTNLGVWLSGGLYPMTLQGLAQCFEMAIPFFGNQVGGDVIFSFAGFAALKVLGYQQVVAQKA